LRFVDSEAGLAFEYEPPRDMRGATILSLVASENRSDVSVGVRNMTTLLKNIRGHDVRLITDVETILEISLCKSGAVKMSHARVVDLAEAPTLEDEARWGSLRTWGVANDVIQSSRSMKATADALTAPTASRSYLVHHDWGNV
jgi:phage head maturation protease